MSAQGTRRHPDVEAFLAAIEDRLRALAVERRADEREELAQHLDLLVIACRARGMDADAAVRAAIERFGRAERIGAALERAARGDHPRMMDYARMFGAYAILWTAMSAVVGYAFHRLAGWPLETPVRTTSSAILMSAVLVYANVRARRVENPAREDVHA